MKKYYLLIPGILMLAFLQVKGEITLNPLVDCLCSDNAEPVFEVIADGSAGPFNYEWAGPNGYSSFIQNPEDIVDPGLYTVSITNYYACETTLSINLVECEGIQNLQINGQDACEGTDGSIEVSYTNGPTPISYAWSTGANTQQITDLLPGTYDVTVTDGNLCETTLTYTIESASAPLVSAQISNTGCDPSNGTGSINLSVVGNAPFSYQWSTGVLDQSSNIENLPEGSYTVTVTDVNTCVLIESFEIQSSSDLELFSTTTDVSCAEASDGMAIIAVSGGIMPYVFTLNNGSSNFSGLFEALPPGSYCTTVIDNGGCSAVTCFEINTNVELTLEVEVLDDCANQGEGNINISVNGGHAPYSYNWLDIEGTENTADRTALFAGLYELEITDANGCTLTDAFTVSNLSVPEITATISSATCEGTSDGAIILSLEGNENDYAFQWVDGEGNLVESPEGYAISGLLAGNYCVTATNLSTNCSVEDCFTIANDAAVEAPYLEKVQVFALVDEQSTLIYEAEWVPSFSGCKFFSGGNLEISNDLFAQLEQNEVELQVIARPSKPLAYLNAALPGVENMLFPGILINDLEFGINFQSSSLGNLISSGELNQVIQFSGITLDPEGLPLLNMWAMSSQLDHCVDIPFIEEDCSWNQTPIFDGGDQAHILYRPCKPVELQVSYPSSLIYVTPTPNENVEINWTLPDNTSSDASSVTLTVEGEYCVEIVASPSCTVQVCEYICPIDFASEIDPYIETLHSCATTATGAICFKTEPLENYDISILEAPPTFDSEIILEPTFMCYQNVPAGSYTFLMHNLQCDLTAIYNLVVEVESSPIQATIQSQTLSCLTDGVDQLTGSLCIEATGGTAPYEYQWINGPSSACIGEIENETAYSVIITDACGTESTHSFSLPMYEPPSITGATIGNTCGNSNTGFIEIRIEGNVSDEDIIWFSTINPCPEGRCSGNIYDLPAGNYTVEVTDQCGNSILETFTVGTTPSEELIEIASTSILNSCGGDPGSGMIDLTMDNPSNTALDFQWSTGATTEDISGLSAGDYFLTISNADECSIVEQFTIYNISTTIEADISHTCANAGTGAIELNITGNDLPYTILWNDGATIATRNNLENGTYFATITSASGCTSTVTYNILPINNIEVSIETLEGAILSIEGDLLQGGAISAVASGGMQPYNFSWSNGASGSSVDNLPPGNYGLTVTDINGCQTFVPNLWIESCNHELPIVTIRPWHITPLDDPAGGAIQPEITNLSNPPYSFSWTGPDGFISSQPFISNLNTPGEYCLLVTDACGREMQHCIDLTAYCSPRVISFEEVDGCFEGETLLKFRGITANGSSGGTEYLELQWSNGQMGKVRVSGTGNFLYLEEVIEGTAEILVTQPGAYSLSAQDIHGCTYSRTYSFTTSPSSQVFPHRRNGEYWSNIGIAPIDEFRICQYCGSEIIFNGQQVSNVLGDLTACFDKRLNYIPDETSNYGSNICQNGGIIEIGALEHPFYNPVHGSLNVPPNDVATFINEDGNCGCLFPPGLVALPLFSDASNEQLYELSDYVFADLDCSDPEIDGSINSYSGTGVEFECPTSCPDCYVEIIGDEVGCPQYNIICPGSNTPLSGPHDTGPSNFCACELGNGFTIIEYCTALSCEIISEQFSPTDQGLPVCTDILGEENCLCDNTLLDNTGDTENEDLEICVCEIPTGYVLQYHDPGNECLVQTTSTFFEYSSTDQYPGTFAYPRCTGNYPPPDDCDPCGWLEGFNGPNDEEIALLQSSNRNSQQANRRVAKSRTPALEKRNKTLFSRAYPNPFTENIILEISSPMAQRLQIRLFNLMGQIQFSRIEQVQEGNNRLQLELEYPLPNGLYHLLIEDEKGNRNIHKVVRNGLR